LIDGNPDMDPETRAEYERARGAYQDVMAQAAIIRELGTQFMRRLVPGFDKLDPDKLKEAVGWFMKTMEVQGDYTVVAKAFAAAKRAVVTDKGVEMGQGKNQVLRDFVLIVESLGARGFAGLAARLTA